MSRGRMASVAIVHASWTSYILEVGHWFGCPLLDAISRNAPRISWPRSRTWRYPQRGCRVSDGFGIQNGIDALLGKHDARREDYMPLIKCF